MSNEPAETLAQQAELSSTVNNFSFGKLTWVSYPVSPPSLKGK